MTKRMLLPLVGLFAFATAQAKVLPHKAAKIQIEVPDSWKVQPADENRLFAADPKDEVELVLKIEEAANVQGALQQLDADLGKIVQNAKVVEKAKEVNVNGMKGIVAIAEGTINGKAAVVNILILETPSKKILLGLILALKDTLGAHADEIKLIQKSLRPMP